MGDAQHCQAYVKLTRLKQILYTKLRMIIRQFLLFRFGGIKCAESTSWTKIARCAALRQVFFTLEGGARVTAQERYSPTRQNALYLSIPRP